MIIEILILLLLIGLAIGSLPPFVMNRSTLALTGAVLLVLLGALSLPKAFQAIDPSTLALLFAMMIFTAHLRMAGFFRLAGLSLARLGHSPRTLLVLVLVFTAILSALFINDTVVLTLTPLLCETLLAMELNPLPFLIGLALSSNIGSMATPIGNPQNILIATQSGLGFAPFLSALALPALASLVLCYFVLSFIYKKDLKPRTLKLLRKQKVRLYTPLLIKCAVAFGIILLGFFLGWGLTLSALAGTAVLLFTRRINPIKVFHRVDWSLLVFFASLFIITKSIQGTTIFQQILHWSKPYLLENLPLFSGLCALLSNLISNVPAVMVLAPFLAGLPHPETHWIALAAASTLAGNLTLLGSVANLIVAEGAKTYNIKLRFLEYLKVGLPVAIGSILLTVLWLMYKPW